MTKNDLVSLLKYRSSVEYPILKDLLSFIPLCALLEADLIIFLGTLTLSDIDHVSIMKSSVYPTPKIGGITGKSDPIMLDIESRTLLDPYIGNIGSKTSIYKDTQTPYAGQSHLMKFM